MITYLTSSLKLDRTAVVVTLSVVEVESVMALPTVVADESGSSLFFVYT